MRIAWTNWKSVEVFGEGIIEPESAIELPSRCRPEFQLGPSSHGIEAADTCGRIRGQPAEHDAAANATAQSSHGFAAVELAAQTEPASQRNIPVSCARPTVNMAVKPPF